MTPARADASGILTAFSIPGEEGNERLAMDRVAAAVDGPRPRARPASSASRPPSARRR